MRKQKLLVLFPLFLFFFFFNVASSLPNDTDSLNRFRTQTDVHGTLRSNWTGPDACSASWRGVECSSGRRVTALSLPSASLRGPVEALSAIDQLRVLDLSDNRLNGTVLPLLNCTNLKLLYLAGNDLSGEIPPEIGSLKRLKRLDLSDNNVRGSIPEEIGRLTHLLTLRLQNNRISGKIPDLTVTLSSLTELNLTNNELYGRVPYGLVKKFGGSSFSGNEALCGFSPLPDCAYEGSSPVDPDQTVSSNPNPSNFPQQPILEESKKSRNSLSRGAIVAIVVAICVASVLIVSFAVANFCAASGDRASKNSKSGSECGDRRKVHGGEESDGTAATERSRLVFFERRKRFELEDLLRASAEMLGKGSLGTVYRAALDDGSCVAVKRLKDANPCVRKEFEEYMDLIGRLKNRNVVRFRAYYYAKEEKLLVYDYLPNGSLHSLLHGNRGPGRIPLDWTTRISIVLGAARGLASVHEQYNAPKIPHGNIKSSNVLLDKNGVACISDFGLSLLLNPAHAIARLGGYSAPEQAETKRLSHKADVYSFGVLLLEVLTGKSPSTARPRRVGEEEGLDLPRWVRSVVKEEWTAEVFDEELLRYKNIEDELVAMLHVALACVAGSPEKRPSMGEVVRMVEEIRVEDSPVGEEYDESRDSLATTEDGLA